MRLAERNVHRHPRDYFVVRYEDMVTHTEATVREVCAFVGEPFATDMLEMPGAPERRERLLRSAGLNGNGPLSSEFIGRFRAALPRHEVVFMQIHARRLMRAHGYTPDELDLSAREWVRFMALRWPSQAARMVTWRSVETVQQRLPTVAGRKPDRRTVVAAPTGTTQ
jgi:hypothetical protein